MLTPELITAIHDKRPEIKAEIAANPLLVELNQPEADRMELLANCLTGVVDGITTADYQFKDDREKELWHTADDRCRGMISRLSASDQIIGMQGAKDDLIVERGGERIKGRSGEISSLVGQITMSDDGISWGSLGLEERRVVAALMLHGLCGGLLEELNYMSNVENIPLVIARKLAVVEKLAGTPLFNTDDQGDIDLLSEMKNFSDIRDRVLADRQMARIRLTEGRRKDIYVPQEMIIPDPSIIDRVKANLHAVDSGHTDQAVAIILEDLVATLGDGVIVFTRTTDKPIGDGDEMVGYAVLNGGTYKYTYKVEINGDKVEIVPDGKIPYCQKIETAATVSSLSRRQKITNKVKKPINFHLAKLVGSRVIAVNTGRRRAGRQIGGAEVPEIGYGLAFDHDGVVNNKNCFPFDWYFIFPGKIIR